MTAILVAPELEKSLVWRRGILTVPNEDATVSCDCATGSCTGLAVRDLPHPLKPYVQGMAMRFVSRLRVRGYEWLGEMRLHGPWESYEFNKNLADIEAAAWKQDDLSLLLPFVIERDGTSPYSDYALLANFLLRNVLTEVVVKEEQDGD